MYVPRTIQLSDDAYATLAALKRAGESFSDEVKRIVAERKDPRALQSLRKLQRVPGWDHASLDARSRAKDVQELDERLGRRRT